jgi:xylulokinase
MASYLVGCDVGTSGTKSVVMDEEGNVLGIHYIDYPLHTPKAGYAEHDPRDYWNAVKNTIRSAIQQSHVDRKDIKGVSISALSPGCILVDKDLNPMQMCHIWLDRRASEEAEYLKKTIGEDRVFKLSANPIDSYYATVKLLWEKNHRPELYDRTYKFQTTADYPVLKLTGKAVTDYSNASLIGIVFDIVNRKWDYKLIEEIGLDPEKFPEAYPCDEIIGEVTGEAAEETGLAKGTPVVAGTVDCNAAWLAAGMLNNGDTQLVMGTAGVFGVCHKEPKFTKDMITIVHTASSREYYTTLAAIVGCGALTRYYRDTFGHMEKDVASKLGIDVFEMMNLKAANSPVGSNGLITLPYFSGERTPIWDPLARGVIFGMSLAHNKGDLLRSFMEGAAFALRHNVECMRASGVQMNMPVILSEGGAQSRLWRQIISDVLRIPVVFMKDLKGAPVGNALNAGIGTGVFKDYSVVKQWLKISDSHEPDETAAKEYDKYYEVFRSVYEDVKGNYVKLHKALGN